MLDRILYKFLQSFIQTSYDTLRYAGKKICHIKENISTSAEKLTENRNNFFVSKPFLTTFSQSNLSDELSSPLTPPQNKIYVFVSLIFLRIGRCWHVPFKLKQTCDNGFYSKKMFIFICYGLNNGSKFSFNILAVCRKGQREKKHRE